MVLQRMAFCWAGALAMSAAFVFAQSAAPATQPYDQRLAAGRGSWAFAQPQDPPVPHIENQAWCKSPIDHFILAKLEAKGLEPAPAADKRTLIRRAYFDLIGLPPTPAEVDAFVNDNSRDSFAKVVDYLLASPHYGERWARHWLDVVRYTDSFDARGVGSAGDVKYAWRYRDWVIKAFNDDLPYDQFVMDQIAGDLLPAKQPGQANADGIVATGMYVLGNWPGGDADREKMMTDIVDDQIDVTGRAFLGTTLACARCHDHKFDPISQQDYYGLAGIFFSSHFLPSPGSKTSGSALLTTSLASPRQIEEQKENAQRIAGLEKQIEAYKDEQYAAIGKELASKSADYLQAAQDFDGPRQKLAAYASERHLDDYALSRWIDFLHARSRGKTPHTLLTRAVHNIGGIVGVDGWRMPDNQPDPCVLANNTDHPFSVSTLTLPAHALSMHPGPQSGVAVAWTSPISATIAIDGGVSDGDPNCGDGIAWRIEKSHDNALQLLASGQFPNGGSQQFSQGDGGSQLAAISVHAGDQIQLTIYPKADYACDTTIIDLRINEREGDHRAWDLAHDVVPDLLVGERGNPHADSYGRADVWQFFDAGAEPMPIALDFADPHGRFWAEARKDGRGLSDAARQHLAELSSELSEARKNVPTIEEADALEEGGVPQSQYEGIHDCHLMARGRYDHQMAVVPRRFPLLFAGDNQPPVTSGSGRLQLAQWVASPENPMTAKVMVNRLWQHHFGDGIVRTPNNFGRLGSPPTHPELLDYLAHRFLDAGWSIKAMHRMIMLSAAYQQSSEGDPDTQKADPDNLLWGRMDRQRLEAEPFRDALLAVSGSLDATMGGPAFRDPNTPRRTIYLMTIRSDRSNYRMLFDAADPTSIVDKRIDSTVAPQALFLMNDPFVIERAKALAQRVVKTGPAEKREKIDWLYQLLYSRPATDREAQIGLSIVGTDAESWQRYCQVLLCANEFVYVD